MGACQYCQHPEEVPALGSTTAYDQKDSKDPLQEAKATVVEVENAIESKLESVAAQVDETKEAVETKTEDFKEATEVKAAEVKEYVENVAEEVAVAANADAPAAVVVENSETAEQTKAAECKDAAEAKQEECKEPAEKVEKVEAPVPEQTAPVTPLVLLVAKKGQAPKTVEFSYKPLGLEVEDGPVKTGCCGRNFKGTVKVSKIEADQQAASLGVENGAIIYQANGKDIASASQLNDLIKEHLTKLPEVAACN